VVTEHIARKPWLGYGYESFWTPEAIEQVTEECQWAVREAHSAYLDMLLSLGRVGLALYCAMVLSGIAAALIAYHRGGDACVLFSGGMALNGFFNGLFESGMVWVSFPTFMIAAGIVRLAFVSSLHPIAGASAWQPRMPASSGSMWGIQP
jgi:O-antigen ligase